MIEIQYNCDFRVRIVIISEGEHLRAPQLELAADESSPWNGYGAWCYVQRSRSHRYIIQIDIIKLNWCKFFNISDLNSESFHTPNGASMRITRPDFLDLSNSLVKKQRFMFTPPHDHPPSGFEEIRQSGDGRPEPVDASELDISEYLTPSNKKMTTRSQDDVVDAGADVAGVGSAPQRPGPATTKKE